MNLYYQLSRGKVQTQCQIQNETVYLRELTPRERAIISEEDDLMRAAKTISLAANININSVLELPAHIVNKLYQLFVKMMNERAWVQYLKDHNLEQLQDAIVEDAKTEFNLEFTVVQSLENPQDIFGVGPFEMTEGQQLVYVAMKQYQHYKMHPEDKPSVTASKPSTLKWTIDRILKFKDIK